VLALIAILGLLILALAALAAVSGVLSNTGSAHALGTDFGVGGLQLSGLSVGQLFLYGIVVGAAAMLGLSMLLGTFSRRLASRGARRDLKGSRRETQALLLDRERLTQQLADQRPEVDGHDTADRVQTGSDVDRAGSVEPTSAVDPADALDQNQPVDRADGSHRTGAAGLLQRVTHRTGGRP
jgi:hypothetical protein